MVYSRLYGRGEPADGGSSQLLPSFEGDAEPLHILQRRELGDADSDPWRLEVAREQFRDVLGELFQQSEMLPPQALLEAGDDRGVIYGVGEHSRFRRLGVGQR